MINSKSYDAEGITGAQVRAARALIRWSANDLADAAGVGSATISRIEVEDGFPNVTSANLSVIRKALEAAGVEFIRDVGVCFRR